MTRVIAIANQKGGTGKTTTAINLAAGLARGVCHNGPTREQGSQRVLLVDADPQANATMAFLGRPFAAGPRQPGVDTAYEVIMGQTEVGQAIQTLDLPANGDVPGGCLDLLPAHIDLAEAEIELVMAFERERKMRQALEPIRDSYHYIIIDCPPSLGQLTVNALMAATEVIIPVDPGVFPLAGLGLLRRTIEMVKRVNPDLHISGVVPSRASRTTLTRVSREQIEEAFGDLLLPAIPQRVAVGEGQMVGQDIFAYDGKGAAGLAFADLVGEVMRRGRE